MVRFGRQRGSVWRAGLASLVLVGLVACTSDVTNHGYVPPPEDLAKVKPGVSTRDSVLEDIGAPTSSGVLNEGGFYYVSTQIKQYGFRANKVVSRELVAISFDRRGVVDAVERYGLEDGVVVPLERRITDPGADHRTFLRQLLGNLTNFSASNVVQQ